MLNIEYTRIKDIDTGSHLGTEHSWICTQVLLAENDAHGGWTRQVILEYGTDPNKAEQVKQQWLTKNYHACRIIGDADY